MAEQNVEITREEFSNWKDNHVTKFLMKAVEERYNLHRDYLASGGTLSKESHSTDFVVGYLKGLSELLNIEYEESDTEKREKYGH